MNLPWEPRRREPLPAPKLALASPIVKKDTTAKTIRLAHMVFEPPKVDFPTMFEWAEHNGTVRDIANYVADQVTGNGIQTDFNEEDPRGEDAKKTIDELFDDVGADDLSWDTVKWAYLTGNVFYFDKQLFMKERKLEILPVDSIYGMKRAQDPMTGYTSLTELHQSFDYGGSSSRNRTLRGDQVMHFRMGLDNTSGFGSGIMQTLLSSKTIVLRDPDNAGNTESIVTAPLIYIITLLIHDIQAAYHTYAKPKRLLVALEAPDTAMNTLKAEWRKPGDVAINYAGDIKNATVEPGLRWQAEIGFLENRFIEVFGMPYNKLFTTPGFTEASARIAKLIADRRIARIQRWLKRNYEHQIINPFLANEGFEPKTAQVRINFGSLDRLEWRIQDILMAGGINPTNVARMTAGELRAMLRSYGWPLNPKKDQDFQDMLESPAKLKPDEQTANLETYIEALGGNKFKITEKRE